eukprot:747574-Hanusia_phi.AAC.20
MNCWEEFETAEKIGRGRKGLQLRGGLGTSKRGGRGREKGEMGKKSECPYPLFSPQIFTRRSPTHPVIVPTPRLSGSTPFRKGLYRCPAMAPMQWRRTGDRGSGTGNREAAWDAAWSRSWERVRSRGSRESSAIAAASRTDSLRSEGVMFDR